MGLEAVARDPNKIGRVRNIIIRVVGYIIPRGRRGSPAPCALQQILALMKSNARPPGNNLCEKCGQKPADAVCFTCNMVLCFQCCIQHSQVNTTHVLKDLGQSMEMIVRKAKDLVYKLEHKQHHDKQKLVKSGDDDSDGLRPENFQRYLDEIDFIKKEVFKFVDRFFSELSLEFVNMWENYLLRFTSGAALIERIDQLIKWIKPYTTLEDSKPAGVEIAKMFIGENFDEKVEELINKPVLQKTSVVVPECPRIVINQRILAEVEETLCKSIFTVNYRFVDRLKPEDKAKVTNIRIETADTLENSRRVVPIFPMKGKFCFLYNLETNEYEIQEFEKLDILPAYPKTIMLPSGDLHLVGGIDQNNNVLQQHLVYRHHKGEIAKLAQLPQPKNPSNGLVHHNGSIYVIGGLKSKGGWDSQCLQYQVKKNEWKSIPSMNSIKPHQTVVTFSNSIIAFGLSFNENALNIERLDLEKMEWKPINVANLLSNPFNFAAGFNSIQVNDQEVLLFGGKNYEDSLKSNKRTTDKSLCPNMYLFNPESCSFTQIDKIGLTTGTQFGEINPIILNNNIYSFEFMLSKVNPIVRWYDTLQVVKISSNNEMECLSILEEN